MAGRAARIVRDDDVMGGEPRIQGRRVTVLRVRDLVEEPRGRGRRHARARRRRRLRRAFHEHADVMAAVGERRDDLEARDAGAKTIDDLEAALEGSS